MDYGVTGRFYSISTPFPVPWLSIGEEQLNLVG